MEEAPFFLYGLRMRAGSARLALLCLPCAMATMRTTGAAAVAYRTFHDIDPAAYKPRRNDDRHGEQGFPRKNASSDENRFRVHTHSLMIPIGSALSIDF